MHSSILFFGVILNKEEFTRARERMFIKTEYVTTINDDFYVVHPPGCYFTINPQHKFSMPEEYVSQGYMPMSELHEWRSSNPRESKRWDTCDHNERMHVDDIIRNTVDDPVKQPLAQKACLYFAIVSHDWQKVQALPVKS